MDTISLVEGIKYTAPAQCKITLEMIWLGKLSDLWMMN